MKNFDLMDRVSFVRVTPEGQVETGEGLVHGKVLGSDKRPKYHINFDGKTLLMPPEALNCSEEEQAQYVEHVHKVRGAAEEWNKKAEDTIKEGNRIVDEITTEFFGAPLVQPEVANDDQAPKAAQANG